MNCGACLRDKITAKACVYCCECSEMLCEPCKTHHGRNKYTSSHKLCEIKTIQDTYKLEFLAVVEKCENHPKEEVKYLCKDHDQLCCNECAIVEHRRCTTLVSIASQIELCSSLEDSAENLKKMDEHANSLLQHEMSLVALVSDVEKTVQEKLETLKKDIDEAFKNAETLVIKSAREERSSVLAAIQVQMTAIENFKKGIKESEHKITAAEEFGKDQHRFLVHREMKAQTRQHETVLSQLHRNSTMKTVSLAGICNICSDFKQSLDHYLKVERSDCYRELNLPALPQLSGLLDATRETLIYKDKKEKSKKVRGSYRY